LNDDRFKLRRITLAGGGSGSRCEDQELDGRIWNSIAKPGFFRRVCGCR